MSIQTCGFRQKVLLILVIIILCITSSAFALKEGTHELLNSYIARNEVNGFDLNAYLINMVGLQNGINEEFDYENKKMKMYIWIEKGGRTEDNPWDEWYRQDDLLPYLGRFYQHFHDPITDNGLWSTYDSSIIWAFKPIEQQGMTDNYSWYDVREYFYQALTATDENTRDENFAKTFRGIGQLMHLVQDLSVPEHVRNDGHVFYSYESWVNNIDNFNHVGGNNFKLKDCENLQNTIIFPSQIPFVFFNTSMLCVPSSLLNIPIPVANLFDNNQYTGNNPDKTSLYTNDFGLSEYTNANFISPDTMFAFGDIPGTGEFPYPRVIFDNNDTTSSIYHFATVDPSDGETEKYYSKIRHGEEIKYFARSYLTNNFMDELCQYNYAECKEWWEQSIRDNRVYANYAQKLIPWAVGYSAQLLEYFFRENIEITLPEDGFYAKTDYDEPEAGFDIIKICAQNISSRAEMTDGTVDLVIRYKVSPCDPFTNNSTFDPACSTRDVPFNYITIQYPQNIAIPKASAPPIEIEFGLPTPIPLWATDVHICLLYRGTIVWRNDSGEVVGQENQTVEVGFKDISEPTPIHIFNNMDKICLDTISPENVRAKGWHNAGADGIVQVDTHNINKYGNNNGKGDEFDVYAHNIKDLYIRFSPIDRVRTVGIHPGEYHYKIQNMEPNTLLTQIYLMTDADIDYIDPVNHKFEILPAFQVSLVFFEEAVDDPEEIADDILKQDHDLFWSHYTIEDKIRYQMALEYYPQVLINQYNFDPNGVFSRFAPQFESYRGYELWEGTKIINSPYHPDIYLDPENPISHCPMSALNQP
jgi:hypothetical protein